MYVSYDFSYVFKRFGGTCVRKVGMSVCPSVCLLKKTHTICVCFPWFDDDDDDDATDDDDNFDAGYVDDDDCVIPVALCLIIKNCYP